MLATTVDYMKVSRKHRNRQMESIHSTTMLQDEIYILAYTLQPLETASTPAIVGVRVEVTSRGILIFLSGFKRVSAYFRVPLLRHWTHSTSKTYTGATVNCSVRYFSH